MVKKEIPLPEGYHSPPFPSPESEKTTMTVRSSSRSERLISAFQHCLRYWRPIGGFNRLAVLLVLPEHVGRAEGGGQGRLQVKVDLLQQIPRVTIPRRDRISPVIGQGHVVVALPPRARMDVEFVAGRQAELPPGRQIQFQVHIPEGPVVLPAAAEASRLASRIS